MTDSGEKYSYWKIVPNRVSTVFLCFVTIWLIAQCNNLVNCADIKRRESKPAAVDGREAGAI